jgi:hypothetical protein
VGNNLSIQLDISDPAIKAKLAELPEKMLEYAFEVLMKQAELIKGLAQVYVPVDTGSLRDSIRIVRAGGYVTNPETGRIVDYAKFQEFGTRYVYGQFYLTRAVEEVQPTIAAMIKAGVVEKVERV